MMLLKTGILALSLTVTATAVLAADYEIFAEFTTVETGENVPGMSNMFGGVPVFGSWKIDPTTGKTEFCISGAAQCVEVTPQ